uniref:Uncharacterized protein n=1 Tax=Romanomermis culicivorax TaxID=13658 RepID=A0A915K4Z1_ROMCU
MSCCKRCIWLSKAFLSRAVSSINLRASLNSVSYIDLMDDVSLPHRPRNEPKSSANLRFNDAMKK